MQYYCAFLCCSGVLCLGLFLTVCEPVEYSRIINDKMKKREIKKAGRRIPLLSLPGERPFALTFALPTWVFSLNHHDCLKPREGGGERGNKWGRERGKKGEKLVQDGRKKQKQMVEEKDTGGNKKQEKKNYCFDRYRIELLENSVKSQNKKREWRKESMDS